MRGPTITISSPSNQIAHSLPILARALTNSTEETVYVAMVMVALEWAIMQTSTVPEAHSTWKLKVLLHIVVSVLQGHVWNIYTPPPPVRSI